MELIALDPRILVKYMKDVHTGEPLSVELANAISDANPASALDIEYQMNLALVDQAYHGVNPPSTIQETSDIWYDIGCKYTHTPPIRELAPQTFVHHFFSYGAHYYVYLWCASHAKLVHERLFSKDPLSPEGGAKLAELLKAGGGKDPKTLSYNLLGYEPTMEEYVSSLLDSLTKNKNKKK